MDEMTNGERFELIFGFDIRELELNEILEWCDRDDYTGDAVLEDYNYDTKNMELLKEEK